MRSAVVLGGKTGLLGQALYMAMTRRGWTVHAPGRADLDLFDRPAVENYLGQLAEQGHLNIGAPDHDLTNRVIRINSPDFLENVMKKKD